MKKILCTILLLVISDKAISDVVFKCSYDQGFFEKDLEATIEVIESADTVKAYMTGNVTRKEVRVIPALTHKNFLDVANNGNVFLTTILANDAAIETALLAGDFEDPTMFESVHSRHFVSATGKSHKASQLLGECSVVTIDK